MFHIRDKDKEEKPVRPCDHEGCQQTGEFRAPKSRKNLREYYYFCLEHIRAYNAQWNYFADFSEKDIFEQYNRDAGWDRPTRPATAPLILEQRLLQMAFKMRAVYEDTPKSKRPKTTNEEMESLSLLGLPPDATLDVIKAQYRKLVKKYHPDKNKGDQKAEEKFKIISNAYIILSKIHQKRERNG